MSQPRSWRRARAAIAASVTALSLGLLAVATPAKALGSLAITPVAAQESHLNEPVSLRVVATDSLGRAPQYSTTTLPPGLGLDHNTGYITGAATQRATYYVTVTASVFGASAAYSFWWAVDPPCAQAGQQLINNPGFEQGSTGWGTAAYPGTMHVFFPTDYVRHSGTRSAELTGFAYEPYYAAVSQSVSVPSGCHAQLTFWAGGGEVEYPGETFTAAAAGHLLFSEAANDHVLRQHAAMVNWLAGVSFAAIIFSIQGPQGGHDVVVDDVTMTLY